MKLPESSRDVQNLQHVVGSLLQVLNYTTAGTAALFATGNIPWWGFLSIASVAFILNRISSELSFQTSRRLFEENGEKLNGR